MSRPPLYPEGATQMNVHIPTSLKTALQASAARQHISVSQLVRVALDVYLSQRGELPIPERQEA